jgi:hypothetical protein
MLVSACTAHFTPLYFSLQQQLNPDFRDQLNVV